MPSSYKENSPLLSCNSCKLNFASMAPLKAHIQEAHYKKCLYCETNFEGEDQLKVRFFQKSKSI